MKKIHRITREDAAKGNLKNITVKKIGTRPDHRSVDALAELFMWFKNLK